MYKHTFLHGIGDILALKAIADVRNELRIPVLTRFHTAEEAELAAAYVDVLQVPAFLPANELLVVKLHLRKSNQRKERAVHFCLKPCNLSSKKLKARVIIE